MASKFGICLLLYGESFVDNRNGFRLKILKNLKKKRKGKMKNFHLEIAFKIAGE